MKKFGRSEYEVKLLSMAIQAPIGRLGKFLELPIEVFTTEAGKSVHRAIHDLVEQGVENIDELAIFPMVEKSGITIDDLFKLTNNWLLMPFFERLCENVFGAFQQRCVVAQLREAVALAETAENATDARDTALGRILQIENVTPDKHIFGASESLESAVDHVRERVKMSPDERNAASGVTCGFAGFDKILGGGFQDSAVYVLGGGTGHGKSVLALNMARHAAAAGHHVLYVSLEMRHTQLMFRLLAAESSISSYLIKNGDLTDSQISAFTKAKGSVHSYASNITFFDQPGISVVRLSAILRQVSTARKVDFMVVDYLQLLSGQGGYSRENEVANLSKGLLTLATANSIPILALSQLNKEGDIRESQAIKHDAYGVMVIRYPDGEPERGSHDVPCEIVMTKHRDGVLGSLPVTFQRSYNRFVEESVSVGIYGQEKNKGNHKSPWR